MLPVVKPLILLRFFQGHSESFCILVLSRSGNLTGALEVQLLDVADGSTTTAWRLEGKQVAGEVPHDRTPSSLPTGMLLESWTVAFT